MERGPGHDPAAGGGVHIDFMGAPLPTP